MPFIGKYSQFKKSTYIAVVYFFPSDFYQTEKDVLGRY